MDAELESFKRADLRAYAASEGYALDKHESSRGSAVMRHTNDDKIIISRQPDGHFTYFSVRDDRDNGTIIDFVQHRKSLNLGRARLELRAWLGIPAPALPTWHELSPVSHDRSGVLTRYMKMASVARHPYLELERRIPASVISDERFSRTIKADAHGNAVFPHYDRDGLCGYELKNKGFTGFASGGTKGLWLSKTKDEDQRLVFSESGIDALSYASIFPDNLTRYASIGGKPNPLQPELVRAEISRMRDGTEIIAAMDSDDAGQDLSEMIRTAVDGAGGKHTFRRHSPETAKDWNDELRARPLLIPSSSRPGLLLR